MLLRQSVSSVAQQLLCACITADMRMHNTCCACGSQLLYTNYYPDLWHTLINQEISLINTKKGTDHCQSPRRERYKCWLGQQRGKSLCLILYPFIILIEFNLLFIEARMSNSRDAISQSIIIIAELNLVADAITRKSMKVLSLTQ